MLDGLSAGPVDGVGDRSDDIEAAKDNSASSICAGYGYGTLQEPRDADAIARAPREIPGLVRSMIEGTR